MRRASVLGGAAVGVGLLAALALGAVALPEEERPTLAERRTPAVPARTAPAPVDTAAAVDDACRDRRSPVRTAVQTSAPRVTLGRSASARLGLRDGGLTGARPVTAEVVDPAGRSAERPAVLTGPAWAFVTFPGDFAGVGDSMAAGTYRVDWWGEDGVRLACDGFVVGATP